MMLRHVPANLERWCQASVVNCKRLHGEMDLFDHLKASIGNSDEPISLRLRSRPVSVSH